MSIRTACPGVATSGLWIALALILCFSGCSSSSVSNRAKSSASASPPSAPIAGYIWDSRVAALRPLSGSLGAVRLESPVSGPALHSALPCPARAFALGTDAKGSIFAIALPFGEPTKLGDAVAPDQRMTLSPGCTNGLIYSPSRGSALLISDLPSSPRVQSLTLGASGPVTEGVIGDSGAILLARPNTGGTTSLHVLATTGAEQTLSFPVQKIGGMALVPGADSVIVADSGANTIYLGKQLSSAPSFRAIASAGQGVSNPDAVATSADGHYAFVANGSGNKLLRVDLSSSSVPLAIPCSCSPTELIPLAGNAGFQITDAAAGLIYALNGDGQTPRTVFIPTDKAGAGTGGAQ